MTKARQTGKIPVTKAKFLFNWPLAQGGYLEGSLELPVLPGSLSPPNLRVLLSTVADCPLRLEPGLAAQFPGLEQVHPTLLYLVRKGKGRRMIEKEAVPNHKHWQQN